MKVHYRHGRATYHITFARRPEGPALPPAATLDGQALNSSRVPLADDGREHSVEVAFS
jgi:hypothetical protein